MNAPGIGGLANRAAGGGASGVGLFHYPPAVMALHGPAFWLPMVCAAMIVVALVLYVVLDGFDLGIGILFAVEPEAEDRDVMVNAIAPVWDGNETWLVFGGAGLFGFFPVAYGTVLPALYPTLIAMLLALIFRGVAFEFRFKTRARRARAIWDLAFFGGSVLAAFTQGLTLGGLIQGVKVVHDAYAGGWWDWLTPFSVLCGLALVAGYALLGATYIVWRTSGDLQRRMRRHAEQAAIATLVAMAAVSVYTPLLHEKYMNHWLALPWVAVTALIPGAVVVLGVLFWWGNRRLHDVTPFLCAIGWFVLCFVGLGVSIWPTIVPPSIDLWQASAPPASQEFLLVGSAILVPTIISYSLFAYYVFRGKIDSAVHYH